MTDPQPVEELHCSLSEIRELVIRAWHRANLPNGGEDDAALAIEWLECRSLPGLQLAAHLFTQPTQQQRGDNHAHALINGIGIFEHLLEMLHETPEQPAHWHGALQSPVALIPFGCLFARQGVSISIQWTTTTSIDPPQRNLALCVGHSTRLRFTNLNSLGTTTPADVKIIASHKPVAVQWPIIPHLAIDAWELDKRADLARLNGVYIAEPLWNQMQTLAAGSYLMQHRPLSDISDAHI